MQPSRQPVRLLRYLPIQNVKDALRPKGPAVRSPGREAGGIGVIRMSAEGAAQWECRALRPSDYGSRSSPPSRAGLFTAGPSALAKPVPSGSWCKQNDIFMCLGVRRTCKTAVRFFLVRLSCSVKSPCPLCLRVRQHVLPPRGHYLNRRMEEYGGIWRIWRIEDW